MINQDKAYPHPVLTPLRDDVTPNGFDLNVAVSPDADNYYIEFSFDHANPTISELVDSGKALYSVHLECRRNFFREMFYFRESKSRFSLAASNLVGRVEVSGFVIAQTSITAYRITGLHRDYADTTFQIGKGDVLAAARTCVFDAFVDYDPLKKISSILTIRKSEEIDEGPMKLDSGDNRLIVTLSRFDYDRYTSLKADPTLNSLLANQVVVPVLVEAIHEISSTSEEDFDFQMDRRWFRSIYRKLLDEGIDLQKKEITALEAVQSLLRLPLRRSLEGLIRMDPMDEQS